MLKGSKAQPKYRLMKLTVGLCSVTLMALFAGQVVGHADDAVDSAVTATTDPDTSTSADSGVISGTVTATPNTGTGATSDEGSGNETTTDTPNVATVNTSEIGNLALDSADKNTAMTTAENATGDNAAKIQASVDALKGWTMITKSGTTYQIGGYDMSRGGEDAILPTVGDFTNLGLDATAVTISKQELYNLAHIRGLLSIKTSDAGGVISSSDDDLSYVFASAYSVNGGYNNNAPSDLKTEIDLSHFDTSNVTNMRLMFYGLSGLQKLNVSGFNTSKVTDMTRMFGELPQIRELDVSRFDTSNVTSMFGMFESDGNLQSLDVSGFNTSKVTTMENMFYQDGSLAHLDVSHFDTSNVTSMKYMFTGMSNLEALDVSGFNTSKVT
ncbi:MAG: BspA family leucine-rich repeat surface protein, partial [Limosilactobacillus sp.]|uniref:BspA family leucine-rich repeat surface protein n=1 Tax=Limosilactobacillus sp. TaxID=2773925 RepID=UPI00270D3D95|nr:BspA family leucine-rich repeat surface protein [Limosilactobacillus sp.]